MDKQFQVIGGGGNIPSDGYRSQMASIDSERRSSAEAASKFQKNFIKANIDVINRQVELQNYGITSRNSELTGRNHHRHTHSIHIDMELTKPEPTLKHRRKQSLITKMTNYGDAPMLPELVPMRNAGSVQSIQFIEDSADGSQGAEPRISPSHRDFDGTDSLPMLVESPGADRMHQ